MTPLGRRQRSLHPGHAAAATSTRLAPGGRQGMPRVLLEADLRVDRAAVLAFGGDAGEALEAADAGP